MDYIRIHSRESGARQSHFILEDFFSRYPTPSPQDLYAWLWEGEFGPHKKERHTRTLLRLTQDIQEAYSFERAKLSDADGEDSSAHKTQRVCEYLGLSEKFLKVNILPYSKANCPLKRLLKLHLSLKEYKSDKFRFKQDWKLVKKVSIEEKDILSSSFDSFERSIDLYLAPEIRYTKIFLKRYNPYYCVVPHKSFFHFFPEYKLPRI